MRNTTNWLLELTPDEGGLVLVAVDQHRNLKGHKRGYDEKCLLCRAGSRISLGRDYGYSSLWPETKAEIEGLSPRCKSGLCRNRGITECTSRTCTCRCHQENESDANS